MVLVLIYFTLCAYAYIASENYLNYTWSHPQKYTNLIFRFIITVLIISFLIYLFFIYLLDKNKLSIASNLDLMLTVLLLTLSFTLFVIILEYIIIWNKTNKAINTSNTNQLISLLLDYPRSLIRYPHFFIPVKAFDYLKSLYSEEDLKDLFISLFNHDETCIYRLINLKYYLKLFSEQNQTTLDTEFNKMISRREKLFSFKKELLTRNVNNRFKSNQSLIIWFIILILTSYYILGWSSEPEFRVSKENLLFEFAIPLINYALFMVIGPSNYIIRKKLSKRNENIRD